MKISHIVCFGVICSTLPQSVSGQDFTNLNFESANVSQYSPGDYVPATVALPNWTVSFSNSSDPTSSTFSTIDYDALSFGPAFTVLEDSNALNYTGSISLSPLQGSYSLCLQGTQVVVPSGSSASIGQTGTIPNTAKSLIFLGSLEGDIQVTFDGQNIFYSAIGNSVNYTIYGADISSYAGQTGQLLFTAPDQTTALLDNVQFLSSSIPEPCEFALSMLGVFFLGFSYRMKWPILTAVALTDSTTR